MQNLLTKSFILNSELSYNQYKALDKLNTEFENVNITIKNQEILIANNNSNRFLFELYKIIRSSIKIEDSILENTYLLKVFLDNNPNHNINFQSIKEYLNKPLLIDVYYNSKKWNLTRKLWGGNFKFNHNIINFLITKFGEEKVFSGSLFGGSYEHLFRLFNEKNFNFLIKTNFYNYLYEYIKNTENTANCLVKIFHNYVQQNEYENINILTNLTFFIKKYNLEKIFSSKIIQQYLYSSIENRKIKNEIKRSEITSFLIQNKICQKKQIQYMLNNYENYHNYIKNNFKYKQELLLFYYKNDKHNDYLNFLQNNKNIFCEKDLYEILIENKLKKKFIQKITPFILENYELSNEFITNLIKIYFDIPEIKNLIGNYVFNNIDIPKNKELIYSQFQNTFVFNIIFNSNQIMYLINRKIINFSFLYPENFLFNIENISYAPLKDISNIQQLFVRLNINNKKVKKSFLQNIWNNQNCSINFKLIYFIDLINEKFDIDHQLLIPFFDKSIHLNISDIILLLENCHKKLNWSLKKSLNLIIKSNFLTLTDNNILQDCNEMISRFTNYDKNTIQESLNKIQKKNFSSYHKLHDELSIILSKMNQPNFELSQAINESFNNKTLNIKNEKFEIYVPKTNHELIELGIKFSHCVGNGYYADQILRKESFIIVLKQENQLITCIEFDYNLSKIKQSYQKNNVYYNIDINVFSELIKNYKDSVK